MVFGEEEFQYLQKKLLLIIEFVSWCCCSTDVDLAAAVAAAFGFKFQKCASCSIKYSKKCAYKLQALGNPMYYIAFYKRDQFCQEFLYTPTWKHILVSHPVCEWI